MYRSEQKKRQIDNEKDDFMPARPKPCDDKEPRKEVFPDRGTKDLGNHFDDMGQMFGRGKRLSTKSIVGGGPDGAFRRFAQPGVEENEGRSADLESLMPNFVRRPREKPTYIPVEMQADYESGGKRREPWDIVAEGIGEIRGNDDKEGKSANRTSEFLVFALRGFGCFKIELGIGFVERIYWKH